MLDAKLGKETGQLDARVERGNFPKYVDPLVSGKIAGFENEESVKTKVLGFTFQDCLSRQACNVK